MKAQTKKILIGVGTVVLAGLLGLAIWLIVTNVGGSSNHPTAGPTSQPKPSPIFTVTPPPHPTITPLPPDTWIGLPNYKATGKYVTTALEGPVYSGGWCEGRGAGVFAMDDPDGGGAYLGGLVISSKGVDIVESDHTTFKVKTAGDTFDQLSMPFQPDDGKYADLAIFAHAEEGNADRVQGQAYYRAKGDKWVLSADTATDLLTSLYGGSQFVNKTVYQDIGQHGTVYGAIIAQGDPKSSTAEVKNLTIYTYNGDVIQVIDTVDLPANLVYIYGLSISKTNLVVMGSFYTALYNWDATNSTYKYSREWNATTFYVAPSWPAKNIPFSGVTMDDSGKYACLISLDKLVVFNPSLGDVGDIIIQNIEFTDVTPAIAEPDMVQFSGETLIVSETGRVVIFSQLETVTTTAVFDVAGAQLITVSNERAATSLPCGYAHNRGVGNLLLPDTQNRLEQWEWELGSKTS